MLTIFARSLIAAMSLLAIGSSIFVMSNKEGLVVPKGAGL